MVRSADCANQSAVAFTIPVLAVVLYLGSTITHAERGTPFQTVS